MSGVQIRSGRPPGWRESLDKPTPFVSKREPNLMCRRVRYIEGEVYECGADSHGHTYCPECAHELATQPTGSRYAYNPGHGPTPQKAA